MSSPLIYYIHALDELSGLYTAQRRIAKECSALPSNGFYLLLSIALDITCGSQIRSQIWSLNQVDWRNELWPLNRFSPRFLTTKSVSYFHLKYSKDGTHYSMQTDISHWMLTWCILPGSSTLPERMRIWHSFHINIHYTQCTPCHIRCQSPM